MNEHRTAARWFLGVLIATGMVVVGAVSPANAAVGSSGHLGSPLHMKSANSAWNGT